jgi:Esterase PHB depolymerase
MLWSVHSSPRKLRPSGPCMYVVHISSGGAESANLGATCPDLFAAIAVHSAGEYGYTLPFAGGRDHEMPRNP